MEGRRRIFTVKRVGVGFLLLFLAIGLSMMSWGIPKQDHRLQQPDITTRANGIYRGEFKIVPPFGTFVANRRFTVAVEVSDGRLASLTIEEPTEMRDAFPALEATILANQTIAVDSLSGATWSKLAYLKAAEVALTHRAPSTSENPE